MEASRSVTDNRSGEFGEVLSDEAIMALNLLEKTLAPTTCYHLSVHALAGTEALETLCLHALIGNQVMLLLIDYGITHSFVNKAFVVRANCQLESVPAVPDRVANGKILSFDVVVNG
jgi:hypothetical protein